MYIAIWVFMVDRTIITIASIFTVAVIVLHRKRTEFLYLATPISFLVAGGIGMYIQIVFLVRIH